MLNRIRLKEILIVVVLLLGLGVAVYLVQVQQVFKSRASIDVNQAFEIKDSQGNVITCNGSTCQTNSDTVTIKLKPNGLQTLGDESGQTVRGAAELSQPIMSPSDTPVPSSTTLPAVTSTPAQVTTTSPSCSIPSVNLTGICGKVDSSHTTAGDYDCSGATDYGLGYANCTTTYPSCYVGCTKK
jgi:type II secretory pathway pseudopilin PulG